MEHCDQVVALLGLELREVPGLTAYTAFGRRGGVRRVNVEARTIATVAPVYYREKVPTTSAHIQHGVARCQIDATRNPPAARAIEAPSQSGMIHHSDHHLLVFFAKLTASKLAAPDMRFHLQANVPARKAADVSEILE
jgi:hypothetical protein